MDHIGQERVKSRDAVTTGDDISEDVNIDSTFQQEGNTYHGHAILSR